MHANWFLDDRRTPRPISDLEVEFRFVSFSRGHPYLTEYLC
jgi:hypothetical protein